MRKLVVFILTAVMFFFLFATPIFAFTAESGDEVNITDSINDDVCAFGANVTVSGDIDGDLITAGGRILVDGNVSGDLMAAGGYLNLNGDVGDDARISGGIITVNGKIRDDLIIGGGQITLGSNASVGGDLIVSGGTIEIDGEVLGDAVLSGGSISISGKIDGNVKIADVGDLTITGDAEIAGDVTYSSINKASISDDAKIGGELKATIIEKAKEVKAVKKAPVAFLIATYFGGKVVSFLSLFVLGIILLLAIPKVFSKFNDRMRTTLGRCVGAGAIMLFGLPAGVLILFIISIILFVTVIGAGLGVIALSSIANLNITPPKGSVVGDVLEYVVEVTDNSRVEPIKNSFHVLIVKEVKKKGGESGERKSPRDDKDKNGNRNKPSSLSIPNMIPIKRDEWDEYGFDKFSALTLKHSSGEGYIFYVNIDNIHLKTEMKYRNNIEPIILETQYKYGMFFITISLIHNLENIEKIENIDDIRGEVERITRAVSPVTLTLITSFNNE